MLDLSAFRHTEQKMVKAINIVNDFSETYKFSQILELRSESVADLSDDFPTTWCRHLTPGLVGAASLRDGSLVVLYRAGLDLEKSFSLQYFLIYFLTRDFEIYLENKGDLHKVGLEVQE